MTSRDSDVLDLIYARALEAIAQGATKQETLSFLDRQFSLYSYIGPNEIEREAQNALRDAGKQGVDREDIDESWF